MSEKAIESVVILGGGTAGWIAACLIARHFLPGTIRLTLIESEAIGTVGVGEASVPVMQRLNATLGIEENEFLAATGGTFKLGIAFNDWGGAGHRYFHGFGDFGASIDGIARHHYWLRARRLGQQAPVEDWSVPASAAARGRFAPPSADARIASEYSYAYHFDAGLYAAFLRRRAEAAGVVRTEGHVVDVALDPADGHIHSLTLADGRRIEGDLFIDCSGFAARLIEGALGTPYHDWSHWLPADRALAVQTARDAPPMSCTLSTAREAGWQWRIPLQHRDGNGYVFSSAFTDEARAAELLLAHLPGKALTEPRLLRFTTGHRHRFWNRNCIAIGLAAGFMEPLESTSIQLIQTGVARLIEFFPDRRCDATLVEEYNRVTANEYARIRDFLILHYHLNRRDEPLWAYCRAMALPDTLEHKLSVWRASARVPLLAEESYAEPSWVAILLGNQCIPDRHDPRADRLPERHLLAMMERARVEIAAATDAMPAHAAWIARRCAALPSLMPTQAQPA